MDSIVTLTMNPALDITTDADVVRPTEKIRCAGVRYDPGGGGVNVAQVAHNLGASVSAMFPCGRRDRRRLRRSPRQRGGSRFAVSKSPAPHEKVSLSTRSAPACNIGSCFPGRV